MKPFVSIIIILILGVFSGCTSRQDYYDELKISGEHVLAHATEAQQQISGSLYGSFFLGCGQVYGGTESKEVLRFTWSPKPNELIMTAVAKSKIKVVIDPTHMQPTVEFIPNTSWLTRAENEKIHVMREFERFRNNINDLVEDDDAIDVVVVRLTAEQLKQEQCLPQL